MILFVFHGVKLRGLLLCGDAHQSGNCYDIVERTVAALNGKVLKKLLVSVQKTNLNICIKYAIARKISFFSLVVFMRPYFFLF